MKTGVGGPLSGLLAKLGLGLQKPGETQVSTKGLQQAEGKDAKGLEKGTELGDGTLLAGIGYNSEDRRASMKNIAEKANIDRFMQDVPAEVKDLQQALREMKEEPAAATDKREPKETADAPKELREERKREEKSEDVRAQAQETKEQRETAEAKEKEREREREKDRDREEEKHGQGWVQEELAEEEEERRKFGLHEQDTLGEHTRCRAETEGTRCLRKPQPGTPYCRAHTLPTP